MKDIKKEFMEEIRNFGISKASKESGISLSTIENWLRKDVKIDLNKAQKVLDCMNLELLIFDKE